jgi:hypothetical protein
MYRGLPVRLYRGLPVRFTKKMVDRCASCEHPRFEHTGANLQVDNRCLHGAGACDCWSFVEEE